MCLYSISHSPITFWSAWQIRRWLRSHVQCSFRGRDAIKIQFGYGIACDDEINQNENVRVGKKRNAEKNLFLHSFIQIKWQIYISDDYMYIWSTTTQQMNTFCLLHYKFNGAFRWKIFFGEFKMKKGEDITVKKTCFVVFSAMKTKLEILLFLWIYWKSINFSVSSFLFLFWI